MANLTGFKMRSVETTSPNEYLVDVEIYFEFALTEHHYKLGIAVLVPSEYVEVRDQFDHILMCVTEHVKDLSNAPLAVMSTNITKDL